MKKIIRLYKFFLVTYTAIASSLMLFFFGFVIPVRIFVPQTFIYTSRKIADTAYEEMDNWLHFVVLFLIILWIVWILLKRKNTFKSEPAVDTSKKNL